MTIEGKDWEFKPRRIARIELDRLRRLTETEKENERHCQSLENSKQREQRDALLQRRRILYKAKQDSMTPNGREVLLQQWRNAYERRKTRIRCGNKDDHIAETSEQLPATTQIRSHDHEARTSKNPLFCGRNRK
ncbi:hypothetical protein MKX01_035930 [Papaver californicum]|nr:hypothetical protein MKX01_035930 [Papaver californicum]